jgi:hypothetical protein
MRLTKAIYADIEKALGGKKIVRTRPMRGTLHFVAAADVLWMLELLTPRIISASAWRHMQLGNAIFDAEMSRPGKTSSSGIPSSSMAGYGAPGDAHRRKRRSS